MVMLHNSLNSKLEVAYVQIYNRDLQHCVFAGYRKRQTAVSRLTFSVTLAKRLISKTCSGILGNKHGGSKKVLVLDVCCSFKLEEHTFFCIPTTDIREKKQYSGKQKLRETTYLKSYTLPSKTPKIYVRRGIKDWSRDFFRFKKNAMLKVSIDT